MTRLLPTLALLLALAAPACDEDGAFGPGLSDSAESSGEQSDAFYATDDDRVSLSEVPDPTAPDAGDGSLPGDASDDNVTDDTADTAETDAPHTTSPLLPLTLSGRVTYDDRPFDTDGFTGEIDILPAQNIVVQLISDADGATLASALTDADGRYSLTHNVSASRTLHVRALSAGRVGGLTVVVRDRTSDAAVYAIRSPSFPATTPPPDLLLHARADLPIGGAMNITDVSTEGFRFILPWLPPTASAGLTYRWQPGLSFPCGSCYRNDIVSLGGQLEDPDEYDDDIILHELGHWFVDHFSADSSPGGPHRDRLVHPRLAYGEGLAYFFVGLVRDTPHIVDNFLGARRWIDMENLLQNGVYQENMTGTSDGTVSGDHREELVSGVLWHAYREPDGTHDFDAVHLGADGHMRVLVDIFGFGTHPDVGASGIDLADWLLVTACHTDTPAEHLQALADAHDYPFDLTAHLDRCPTVTPHGKRTPHDTPASHHKGGPAPFTATNGGPPPALPPFPTTVQDSPTAAPLLSPPEDLDAHGHASCALKDGGFRYLTLSRTGGAVTLVDAGGAFERLTGAVEIDRGGVVRRRTLDCPSLPCPVATGVDDATLVVVTAHADRDWAAGSWLGPLAAQRLLGRAKLAPDAEWGALRVYEGG